MIKWTKIVKKYNEERDQYLRANQPAGSNTSVPTNSTAPRTTDSPKVNRLLPRRSLAKGRKETARASRNSAAVSSTTPRRSPAVGSSTRFVVSQSDEGYVSGSDTVGSASGSKQTKEQGLGPINWPVVISDNGDAVDSDYLLTKHFRNGDNLNPTRALHYLKAKPLIHGFRKLSLAPNEPQNGGNQPISAPQTALPLEKQPPSLLAQPEVSVAYGEDLQDLTPDESKNGDNPPTSSPCTVYCSEKQPSPAPTQPAIFTDSDDLLGLYLAADEPRNGDDQSTSSSQTVDPLEMQPLPPSAQPTVSNDSGDRLQQYLAADELQIGDNLPTSSPQTVTSLEMQPSPPPAQATVFNDSAEDAQQYLATDEPQKAGSVPVSSSQADDMMETQPSPPPAQPTISSVSGDSSQQYLGADEPKYAGDHPISPPQAVTALEMQLPSPDDSSKMEGVEHKPLTNNDLEMPDAESKQDLAANEPQNSDKRPISSPQTFVSSEMQPSPPPAGLSPAPKSAKIQRAPNPFMRKNPSRSPFPNLALPPDSARIKPDPKAIIAQQPLAPPAAGMTAPLISASMSSQYADISSNSSSSGVSTPEMPLPHAHQSSVTEVMPQEPSGTTDQGMPDAEPDGSQQDLSQSTELAMSDAERDQSQPELPQSADVDMKEPEVQPPKTFKGRAPVSKRTMSGDRRENQVPDVDVPTAAQRDIKSIKDRIEADVTIREALRDAPVSSEPKQDVEEQVDPAADVDQAEEPETRKKIRSDNQLPKDDPQEITPPLLDPKLDITEKLKIAYDLFENYSDQVAALVAPDSSIATEIFESMLSDFTAAGTFFWAAQSASGKTWTLHAFKDVEDYRKQLIKHITNIYSQLPRLRPRLTEEQKSLLSPYTRVVRTNPMLPRQILEFDQKWAKKTVNGLVAEYGTQQEKIGKPPKPVRPLQG